MIDKNLISDEEGKGLKRKHAEESSDDDSSDSDYDVEDTAAPSAAAGAKGKKDKDGFEVVSQDPGNTLLEQVLKALE